MKALAPFAAGVGFGLLILAIVYLGVMQYATDVPLSFIFTGRRQ